MQNSQMSMEQHSKTKGNKILFPLVVCVAVGELVTLLVVLIGSILVSSIDLPKIVMTVIAFIAVSAGALAVGLLTGRVFRKDRLFMGAVNGIIQAVFLVLLNLIFFREPVTTLSLVKYCVIIAATVIGALMAKPPKRKRSKR